MQEKTYIFDIDGTISKNGMPIESAIYKSIEKLRQKHEIIFASARPVRDILPMLPEHFHDALIIGCNGGMVWQKGEFKSIHYFPRHDTAKILEYLRGNNIPYIMDGSWHYAFSETEHPFQNYVASLSDHQVAESTLIEEGVTKILILDSQTRVPLEAYLDSHSIVFSATHHKRDDFFDLTPHADDKYQALDTQGIDFDSAVVFGNDANDFAMLRHAAVSVFVGDENTFDGATYYCQIDDIPQILAGEEQI
jgi:HAD superfamily hydrolase (TIGR01484 family)